MVTGDRHSRIEAALPDYRRRLRVLAHSMTATVAADVDDLCQEAYLAMWRAVDTHRPGSGDLAGYLMVAARGRMIDAVTGRKRASGSEAARVPQQGPTVSMDALMDDLGWDAASDVDTLDLVLAAYFEGEIAAALDSLPPHHKAAVVARFWHGERNIAERMRAEGTTIETGWWGKVRPQLAERLADLIAA